MKNYIFLLIVLVESNLFGQTDSLEKAILYNKFISKEITEVDFSRTMVTMESENQFNKIS